MTITPRMMSATPHHELGYGRNSHRIAVTPELNNDQPIVVLTHTHEISRDRHPASRFVITVLSFDYDALSFYAPFIFGNS